MMIFDRAGRIEGEYCDVFVREQRFPIENQTIGEKMQETQTTAPVTTEKEPMPAYKSHKTVHAVKIQRAELQDDGSGILIPEDPAYSRRAVSASYMAKHLPAGPGYYVQYEDGYESWSPVKAFEEGYAKLEETTGTDDRGDIPDYSHDGIPTNGDIDTWGKYHTPKPDQIVRYGELRDEGLTLMRLIKKNCPPGADRTAAIRKVREAIMTANAAIACGE